MPLLNKLASFFGRPQPNEANRLADLKQEIRTQSPYLNYKYLYPTDMGLGGTAFDYGDTLQSGQSPLEIRGYRYDRRTQKPESLPLKFNMEDLRLVATAVGDAVRSNVPGISEHISPEVITAMLLKEGRGDLGANHFNTNDSQSRKIYNEYAQKYGPMVGVAIAAMYDKAKVAKRLNIPFASAWIGTGRSPYETSEEYAADTEKFKEISLHPKNRFLLNFVRGSMMPPLSGEENY